MQVFQNFADDGSLVDDGDNAHGVMTSGTFQRLNLIDFLYEPCPVGF